MTRAFPAWIIFFSHPSFPSIPRNSVSFPEQLWICRASSLGPITPLASCLQTTQEVAAPAHQALLCGCTLPRGWVSHHQCPQSLILLEKCILHISDCLTHSPGARTPHFYLFTTGNLKYKYIGWEPGSSGVKDRIPVDVCGQRTSLLCFWLFFTIPGSGLKGHLKRLCCPERC